MEKTRTTVHILGKEYNMTSYDSESYVKRVGSFVDRKMTELSLATKLPYAQLAVLTALNVTDDMLKAHDENNRLKKELEIAREEIKQCQAELARLRGAQK